MDRDRTLELKVGVFVAIGLAMIAGFVVKFGRVGEGFKTYYDLTFGLKMPAVCSRARISC
jgi:ABC-type transporter Mla subunit MlaD